MARKTDPVRADNTATGSGQHVVQAGTIIGDIYPPPERRARGLGYAAAGLLVGVVLVLVTLRVLQDSAANDASEPDPAPTTSSVAPASTSATAKKPATTTKSAAATGARPVAPPANPSAAPTPLPTTTTTTTTTTVAPTTSSRPSTGHYLPYPAGAETNGAEPPDQ